MVKGLVIAGSIIFNKFVEIPSNPQLFLLARFIIVIEMVSSSTGLKLKTQLISFASSNSVTQRLAVWTLLQLVC